MFRKGTRKDRKQVRKQRETRRRRLSTLVSRKSQLEALEQRNLLAAYVVDVATDDAADISGVIDGDLSLREAIIAANTNAPFGDALAPGAADGDSITFAGALAGATITLGNGQIFIGDDVAIDGSAGGASRITIDAAALSRVVDIFSSGSPGIIDDVDLANLILTNGDATGSTGGGIRAQLSPVALTNVDVTDSTAGDVGGVESDGGSMTIIGGTVSGNTTLGSVGGISGIGGTTLNINGTTIEDNSAGFQGGGVFNFLGSTATIDGATISDNTASGPGGGGIYNSGSLDVINGTVIVDNVADGVTGSGGGILNDSGGTLNVDNSLILSNDAERAGGGIEDASGAGTPVTLTNVALDGNNAFGTDPTAPGNGGGLHVTGDGNVDIDGGSVSGNFAAGEGGGLWNSTGTMTLTSASAQLVISVNTASGDFQAVSSVDLQGGGGIFNNGGDLIIDGSGIGIGVENNLADGLTSPTTTAGSGGGIMSIGGNVTINEVFIFQNEAVRAGGGIEVIVGTVDITNSTIDSNDVSTDGLITSAQPGNGGGLHITSGATVTIDGGGITGNTAQAEGGGLWNSAVGTLNITSTSGAVTIENNEARGNADGSVFPVDLQGGGGIFNNGDGINPGGRLDIDGSANGVSISNNTASGLSTGPGTTAGSGGGILSIDGLVTINDARIGSNEAIRAGGGIEIVDGALRINDSEIDNNDVSTGGAIPISTPGNGGGIHVTGPALVELSDTMVNANAAGNEGGGLWNSDTGSMTIDGGQIVGNTASGNAADDGGGGIFNNGGLLGIGFTASVDITNNVADGTLGSGGGIFNNVGGSLFLGTGLVNISGNTAERAGGGIEHVSALTLNLNDITLNDNAAQGAPGNGGGLHISGAAVVNIIGGTVNGNSAAEEGGGLWNGGGTMTINGTTISGNTASGDAADQGGGGVFSAGGDLVIGNVSAVDITNNVANGAAGSGGGILNDGGNTEVTGGNITGNSAIRAGGGIEITGASLFLGGVNLSNNTAVGGGAGAPGNGGGLHVSGAGDVDIDASTVNGNSAALEGGGLWNGGGTMTIDGTTIDGNTASGPAADDGGGGIFNQAGVLEIGLMTPSNVTNNVADGALGSGGGIFLNSSSSMVMNGGVIVGNVANRAGGGIEDASDTGLGVTLNNVILEINRAIGGGVPGSPGNGGGIHVSGNSDVSITDGIILGNSAALEGGGLWNGSGTMTVLRTPIVVNTASGPVADDGGGGIFNSGGTVDLDDLVIDGNVADGAAGSGGGILNLGGSITINSVLITANTANRAGGGIEDRDGTGIDITDSVIRFNDAGTNPGNGGGIHITGTGTVNLDGTTVHNNTAVEGGGLWNSGGGTFNLINSTISTNAATGSDGGGIFNTSGGTVITDSVTVTLNSASTGVGSGIAGGTSGVTLENTIVAQNPGGGTEQNLSGGTGAINSADFNLIGDPDDGTLTGLTVNTIFGGDALLLPLMNNGGPAPPVLVTHLPGAGSPAIGFGSTTQTDDQRDALRPQGSQDDIGAIEVDLNGFVITANDAPLFGQAGDGNPDEFLIINDPIGLSGDVLVFVNSRLLTQTFPKATTGLIVIRGSADDDTVIIDNSNGLIGTRIVFDGDGTSGSGQGGEFPVPGGFDVLRLVGDTPVNTTYNPGETADAGAVFQENNQIVQKVEFFGLEPIQVLAPAGGNNILNLASAPLGVGFPQALNGQNTINYVEGPNSNDPADVVFAGALTGLLTVDGFESLEFANFEVLNIDAGPGSDEINLNNPVTPDELGVINVDGDDPTASDTLIANSVPGIVDSLTLQPSAQGVGTITGAGPDINYVGIEDIELVVQSADGDGLDIDGTAGNDAIEHTPLANGFSGVFTGALDLNNATGVGPFSMPRTTYHNVDQNTGIGVNENVPGGEDTVVYHGTSSNDQFTLNGELLTQESNGVTFLFAGSGTDTTTTQVVLVGENGDDVFNIMSNDNAAVDVQGGNPSGGSDVLNFTGSGVGAVTLDLEAKTVQEAGFGAVSYAGVETVNIEANEALTVNGGDADDTINVTPTGAGQDGTFDHNHSPGVIFNYTLADSAFFNGALGENQLNILGSVDADTITSAPNVVTVNGSSVTIGGGFDSTQVLGLLGNDDIDLSNLTTASPITIRGGDGDDTITGTPQNDLIFGGSGNDVLVGAGANDTIYGEAGNDTIGGAAAGSDDPGNDFFFGGDGSDLFIWEPGDAQDTISGGDDGNDIFEFRGRGTAGDTMTLAADGAGVDAIFNAATINVAGVEDIVVAPGDGGAADVTIEDLFGTEVTTVDVDLPAAGSGDAVDVDGRNGADNIDVAINGAEVVVNGLTYDVSVSAGVAGEDRLTINGRGGDDSIKVAAGVEAAIDITLNGGDGDDFLSADAIINGGAGNDILIGGAGNDTINGNAGDDLIDGRGGVNTVDGGAGEDTILVTGTAAGETLGVTHTAGTVTVAGGPSAGTQNISNMERVAVNAGDGADTINITTLAAGGLNYDVLGGNPIGAVGDTLNLTSPTGVTFMAGPESDSGALVDNDGAIISYDEIEDVSVTIAPAGPVVIMGTGADDDITAAGVGANSVDVTVNNGPTITYVGVTTLTLQGKEGDDDITIDVNNAINVAFIVDGGLPTTGSDDLRITGDDTINDNPTWTPDAVDGGDFALDSLAVAIDVTGIENLFYDGEADNETLTVVGTAGDDRFVHTPADDDDAGNMQIDSLLGVNYVNLGAAGSLVADGGGQATADVLGMLGTPDGDQTVVAATTGAVTMSGVYGDRIAVAPNDIEVLQIDGRDGNDLTNVATPLPYAAVANVGEAISITDEAGADDIFNITPGVTPVLSPALPLPPNIENLGTVTVNGVPIVYLGSLNVVVAASDDAGDALTINDDGGDNNWLVTSGGTGDAVQIDNRESIDYNGFSSVDLTNGAGTDNFTIHPTSLSGFNSSLTVNGDAAVADDTVTLIGTEAVDTVTSTATAVTVNGVEITVGNTNFAQLTVSTLGGDDTVDLDLNLASVHKVVDLGEGDDSLDASGMQDGDFFGGIGNDTIVGSPLADRIFGGPGNDILIGGAGSDFQYGGDGNDIFGNPTLVADGVADDPGTDFNFGGNGFDNFVWEPGDGTDFNNGGDDAADVFRFFARNDGAASTFDLRSGGTPTHFNAVFNGTVIDNHGIEDVIVDPLDGNDTVNVNDLFATEVVNVTIIAGGGDESITVEGRNVADDIDITVAGTTVRLEGLSYDVLINSPAAGGDRLTVSGNDGDDFIKAQPGVEAIIDITLNGDNDNDTLSADAIINGGAGDDFLIGGAGNDTINGNDGEDTMIGGAGNDVFDGGLGFDTILIQGTSGQDVINVFQALPTTLIHTVNGNTESDTLLLAAGNRTVEQALVVAGDGADLIRVNWLDAHGVNANTDSLRMTVEGGSDATSDRLVVVDDGTDDLVLYRKGQADNSGTVQVGPGNAEPLLNVFSDVENIDFVDENGNAIVNAPAGPQLVVFKHDPFESNDDRFTATYLGSGDTINVDPTIDPGPLTNPFGDGQDLAGDSDFYRVVAETTGTLDFQVYFRQVPDLLSGRPGLPNDGNLDIFVRDAAGNVIANFGVNDADDDERVRIPAVEGQTYFLEVFGDNGDAINIYNFTVVNHAPPVPYALELWDNPPDGTTNPPGTSNNSDTGRSQFDNHTYDNTPTLFFRLDDGIFLHDLPGNPAPDTPPDEVIDIPFREGIVQPNLPGFAIAIFDEGNTLPQTGTPPQTPLGFATSTAQDGVYTFTVPVALALSEGSHFLSARVQMLDPANPLQTGFGERSLSLEIVVDETPPPVAFGLATVVGDGLHPDSDSGDPVIPATLVDRITNDETPTFFGRAEANSIVRLYVDMDNTDTLTAADLLIGQTVANPLDGTEQLETPANPLEPGGQWEITSTVNMNDPRILAALGQPKDGLRTILLSAEDLAGNITAPDQNVTLEIFVDTQGPQVTDVFITGIPTSVFNLFTLKPETPQPTPRVDSLTISVRDLPNRVAQFLYAAISNGPPAPLDPIVLVGDHNGAIPIAGLAFNSDPLVPGSPATGEIVLNFDEPLPDDRFTLTLSDNLIDPVGNKLDGESNAAEPIGIPDFQQPGRTTGDGIPGGEFIARFTVDSRPEVATWSQGVVYADINGNFVWDPEGQDNDFTNRDFVMNFGEVTDAYFAGNFATAGAATASGFDKLGAYGAVNGQYQFFLDTNDDGVGDTVGLMAFQVNAIPVAGNFSGGHPGDEIGAFDGRNWYLDTNGNNHIDAGEQLASDLRGIPLVGDFNGDGDDDLATYNNDTGIFQFDLDRDGDVDDTLQFGFAGFGDRPVAGDMNLDGIDDIVMWVTDQNAQLPKESGEFHFLVSDRTAALPSNVFDPFSPAPLGNDLISQFGDEFALPLIGNFDPPINDDGNGSVFVGSLSNELNPLDTTVDGIVSARDALVVINALARENLNVDSSPLRVVASLGGFKLDATQDGDITARDALVVINGLAQIDPVAEEAEQSNWAASADSAIADIEEEDDDLLALLALDQESSRVKS